MRCVKCDFVLTFSFALFFRLDVFAYHKNYSKLKDAIAGYLSPLLDFARNILKEKRDDWSTFPIYLKATGGLRTLSHHDRVRVMKAVRELFHDKNFNPFDFVDERARVISGEEEAIYGWVGVNFGKIMTHCALHYLDLHFFSSKGNID